ncbi:hypothetical protein KCU88_g173, partial [Aureobasidium melanogenum]
MPSILRWLRRSSAIILYWSSGCANENLARPSLCESVVPQTGDRNPPSSGERDCKWFILYMSHGIDSLGKREMVTPQDPVSPKAHTIWQEFHLHPEQPRELQDWQRVECQEEEEATHREGKFPQTPKSTPSGWPRKKTPRMNSRTYPTLRAMRSAFCLRVDFSSHRSTLLRVVPAGAVCVGTQILAVYGALVVPASNVGKRIDEVEVVVQPVTNLSEELIVEHDPSRIPTESIKPGCWTQLAFAPQATWLAERW